MEKGIGKWVEAMRLRTLPVSVAGVLAGTGCALWQGRFSWVPALLCLLFALLAQIASNFGNEYYDFKNGLDRKGREGFRRGVTEGDISPRQMKLATFLTLGLACAVGCLTLFYGGWWLILVGIAVAVFALAYSTGPYPLSHHGLGDIAVVIFFGLVPVMLTCYLQVGGWEGWQYALPVSLAVGLLAANVLVVNNYRDMEDDWIAGKHTTVVLFGRRVMAWVYLYSGLGAMFILLPVWRKLPLWCIVVPLVYMTLHYRTWKKIVRSRGALLNPLLGRTAMNLMLFSALLLGCFILDFYL